VTPSEFREDVWRW